MRSKAYVAETFDGKADRYRIEREQEYGFVVQKDLVLEMIEGKGGRGLEIGCGSGGLVPDLINRGYEMVGIDLSLRMVRAARMDFTAASAAFSCGDMEKLSFPDGAFDLVVCMGVLEYLPDATKALAEIRRVLVRGGEVLVTVPTSVSPSAIFTGLFDALPVPLRRLFLRRHDLPAGDTVYRPSPGRLDRLLASSGLRPQEGSFCDFTMFPFDRLAPRLTETVAWRLEPLGRSRLFGRLGRQYVVRAVAK